MLERSKAFRFTRPTRLLSLSRLAQAGEAILFSGREVDIMKAYREGAGVPVHYVPGAFPLIVEAPQVANDGEPVSYEFFCRRNKEKIEREGSKLSSKSRDQRPVGKSWEDVWSEGAWAKLCARRETRRAEVVSAEAEYDEAFNKEAAKKVAEAEALLVEAQRLRDQAVQSAELVSYETAEHNLKIARDTFGTFEQVSDPRASEARERLDSAEAKFAEAKRLKLTYEARKRLLAAQEKITALPTSGTFQFPRARIEKAFECSSAAQTAIDAGDFPAFEAALRKLAEWIELPRSVGLPIVNPGETLGAG